LFISEIIIFLLFFVFNNNSKKLVLLSFFLKQIILRNNNSFIKFSFHNFKILINFSGRYFFYPSKALNGCFIPLSKNCFPKWMSNSFTMTSSLKSIFMDIQHFSIFFYNFLRNFSSTISTLEFKVLSKTIRSSISFHVFILEMFV